MSNAAYGLRPDHLDELHRRVPAPPKPWSVEDQMSYGAALYHEAMKIKDENSGWYPIEDDEDED